MPTKLGPGVINPTAEALTWARRAPIVKAMDRIEPLEAAPANAIRIFRASAQNENDTSDPIGTVNRTITALKGYSHPQLYLQLWTGAHPTPQQLDAAVDACHRHGYKTVGSSWFTGDYTQKDWDDATIAGVDMYAPQCYWGTQGFTPFHAVRYRSFWQPGQAPVVIAECGRDAVEGGRGGYYMCGFTDAQIVTDLNAYDAEIAHDSYVVGATPFTCGPTPDWQTKGFNLDPVAHSLGLGGSVPTTLRKYTHGCDISNNNGRVSDWTQLARCIDFVEIKATEYDFQDPFFKENWKAARDNGLVRIAYDFARPSLGSGHDEATRFLDFVNKSGGILSGDIPMLDMEDVKVNPTADLLAYVIDWLDTVEAAWGAPPWLYSASWYLKPHNLQGHTELAKYGLNYAEYGTVPPTVPAPWTFWTVWQYSSSGTLPGLSRAVDLDLFNGTLDQLRKYGKP